MENTAAVTERENVRISAQKRHRDWKLLQARQMHRGRKRQAEKTGRDISTALFLLKREGRAPTDPRSHKRRVENLRADYARERARKTYTAYIISEYMKRIREDGWAAVEAGLPVELREVLLKACESKGISTADKGEKAKENEAKRRAENTKAANKKTPAAGNAAVFAAPFAAAFNPDAYIESKIPADIAPEKRAALIESEKAAMRHLERLLSLSHAFEDEKIAAYAPTFVNSNSVTVKYQTTVNGNAVDETVSGDRVNKTKIVLDEGKHLFEQWESGRSLSEAEQKRLNMWLQKGVKSSMDFVPKDGEEKSLASKKAGQMSEKGLTGKFAERLTAEKSVHEQTQAEKALKNIDAKLAQAEFVVRKQKAGLTLDADEKRLLEFAQNTLGEKTGGKNESKPLTPERLAEMRRPENRKALIEFGKGEKPFVSDEYGTMISVEKQLAALRESPAKYAEMNAKGAFPKGRTFNPLNVKAGTSVEKFNLLCQKSARDKKNPDRKAVKFFAAKLNEFAKKNKETTVSAAAIDYARLALADKQSRKGKKRGNAKENGGERKEQTVQPNETSRVENALRKAAIEARKQETLNSIKSAARAVPAKTGLMQKLTERRSNAPASPSPVQTVLAVKRQKDAGR